MAQDKPLTSRVTPSRPTAAPRAQAHLARVGEQMGRLARQRQPAVVVAREVAGHLNTEGSVDDARLAVDQIDRAGLSSREADVIAALDVRAEGLNRAIGLALVRSPLRPLIISSWPGLLRHVTPSSLMMRVPRGLWRLPGCPAAGRWPPVSSAVRRKPVGITTTRVEQLAPVLAPRGRARRHGFGARSEADSRACSGAHLVVIDQAEDLRRALLAPTMSGPAMSCDLCTPSPSCSSGTSSPRPPEVLALRTWAPRCAPRVRRPPRSKQPSTRPPAPWPPPPRTARRTGPAPRGAVLDRHMPALRHRSTLGRNSAGHLDRPRPVGSGPVMLAPSRRLENKGL